jgi:hypothetical protein
MLDTLIVRGQLDAQSVNHFLFTGLNESAKVYTLASQTDSFKKLFAGTVLTLDEYKGQTVNNEAVAVTSPFTNTTYNASTLYDLQGRRVTNQPRRGVYIRDGWKVVVK